MYFKIGVLLCISIALLNSVFGQRVVTIQLDGTQYYVSKMNPYASELNYFLAYQYCRSIGLQLVSFETREKADSIAEYLKNAGYSQNDFWTSGNHLGSNMLLWLSSGLPFNTTFNYMRKQEGDEPIVPNGPLPMGRRKRGNGIGNNGCISLKAHSLDWDSEDCSKVKDFICEQSRCYFYNYGSIPVSSAQGTGSMINYSSSSLPPSQRTSVTQYLTKSTNSNFFMTTQTPPSVDTTTAEFQKDTATEPPTAQSVNANCNENNSCEEETNEISLIITTESLAAEAEIVAETTFKNEKIVPLKPKYEYRFLISPIGYTALHSDNEVRNITSRLNRPIS